MIVFLNSINYIEYLEMKAISNKRKTSTKNNVFTDGTSFFRMNDTFNLEVLFRNTTMNF